MWLTGHSLPVFIDHLLFDFLKCIWEWRACSLVHEIVLGFLEDEVVEIVHEVVNLRFLGYFESNRLAYLYLIFNTCNPAVEISRYMFELRELLSRVLSVRTLGCCLHRRLGIDVYIALAASKM